MDQNISTSFIPKRSLIVSKRRTNDHKSIGLALLLSLIIFLGTISIAVSEFLYHQFLLKSIERKSENLSKARGGFEPNVIQEMRRLDTRMRSASELLSNHKAVSSFFDLLEAATIVSMQFENFNYQIDDMGQIKVAMKGKAPSFGTVALQSEIFGENKFIQNSIFSNLNLDEKGNVGFDFTATIDPKLVLYENTILDN